MGNDGPSPRGGPPPLRHLPPLDWGSLFQPAILKTMHEKEIKELLDRIMSNKGPINIAWWWLDTRPKDAPPLDEKATLAQKAAFEKETRRMLDELAHTRVGFQLLSDLDKPGPYVVANSWTGPRNETEWETRDLTKVYALPSGAPSTGGPSVIKMNPHLTTFAMPGEKELPWMSERVQFGLYHELIHAWHARHGTLARGDHNTRPNAEWQAVGLGPYEGLPITENKIRQQLGKDLRPEVDRKTY